MDFYVPSRKIEVVSSLSLVHIYPDKSYEDCGVVSREIVTNVGLAEIIKHMAAQSNVADSFKYHGVGTGTTAASVSDTALQSEVSVTRGTATPSYLGNTYTTAASVTFTAGPAYPLNITEHGVFSAAVSGVLLDRHVFTARAVTLADIINFTYQFTLSAV